MRGGLFNLVDGLEFLAGLEAHRLAGWDIDFRAGAWVASNAGLAGSHVEDAEATQLDAVAAGKRALHALKDGFHGHFRLGFGDAGLGHHFIDDVELDHAWTPQTAKQLLSGR